MSKRETVLIVSRVFALYLFIWALNALAYLPMEVALAASNSHGSAHWSTRDMLSVEGAAFRVVVLLAASFLFYECGPRVQRFLLPEEKPIEGE